MAILHGKNAKVLIGDVELERVKSVSFKPKVDKQDVTTMGMSAVSRVAGVCDVQCTITCIRDDAATQQTLLINNALAGTPVTVKLYPDRSSAKYYTFTGLVDFETSMETGSVETITYTIENSDGNLPTST